MSPHLGRRRLLRQCQQRRDVFNEKHQKDTAAEGTQSPRREPTQQYGTQQRSQLHRQCQRGRDDITRYQKTPHALGKSREGQAQQTLHSWRNDGGNYHLHQETTHSHNTNTLNNESINGHIDYSCDKTNKISIASTAPIRNGKNQCNNKRHLAHEATSTHDNTCDKKTTTKNNERQQRTMTISNQTPKIWG